MFDIQNLWLFFVTSFLINIAPGPDMLYIAARSLSQGSKAGILGALGIFTGCLVHILAAVYGLSAVIAHSVFWFNALKIAGAAYLIYLGVKALIEKTTIADGTDVVQSIAEKPLRAVFFQGFMTNLLNPKVAIFFLSFLPQFVDPQSPNIQAQIALLGLWFDLQGTLMLVGVALLTGYFREMLQHSPRFWQWQGKVTGAILVGLGLKMMAGER